MSAANWLELFVFVAIVFLIIRAITRAARPRATPAPNPNDALVHAAQAAQLDPIDVANIVHHADEKFYWAQPAKLWEIHHHVHYEGGSVGGSVRVVRGVYLRSSSFRGQPVTTDSMDPDDVGTVYLSNERIIFVGARGTKDFPYVHIGSVQPHADGMRVDVLNKLPVAFETGDGRLAVVFGRVMNKDFAAKTPLQNLSADQVVANAANALKGQGHN